MRSSRSTVLVAVCLLSLAGAGTSRAKPSTPEVEAMRHYDAGSAAYKTKQFGLAADEYAAGYRIKPDPTYLYWLAQSCRLDHQLERALDYYRQYLAAVPGADNRATVEKRIAAVEEELSHRPPADPFAAPPQRSQRRAAAEPPPATATENGAERSAGEPQSDAERAPQKTHPAAVTPAPGDETRREKKPELSPYQLGVRGRAIFVTPTMMSPFLQASTAMSSGSVGIEFIYRKATFDVVTSLDFSWLAVQSGNYLAVGHDPSVDTHYVEFPNLSFLSVDVSLIGHTDLTSWLELRYGAGLGIGAVLGDVVLTNNSPACTSANVSDTSRCYPLGGYQTTLGSPGNDSATSPTRHVSPDKPPVMGVLNVLVGARFKITQHISAQVEVGFRDMIFVGAGAHYSF